MSPGLAPFLHSVNSCSTSSDHRAVAATFAPSQSASSLQAVDLAAPSRPWALHHGVWHDLTFSADLRGWAALFPPPGLTTGDAQVQWTAFHLDLCVTLRRLSRAAAASQLAARADLEAARFALDHLDLHAPPGPALLPGLLRRWRAALKATSAADHVRASGHSSASALRAGSWLYAAHRPAGSTSLPPLHTPNGPATTPASQLRAISAYYQALFAPRAPDPLAPAATSLLLANLQLRLPPDRADALAAPFSRAELLTALRGANRHSSSGPDGIPYRVYLATFDAAGPYLLALANSLASGGALRVHARTVLLAKAGDPADLANYRPITISDAYVRTISRLVSARLSSVGSFLLPWTQAAFLPGRQTSIIAAVLHGLAGLAPLAAHPLQPPACFVVSLDQRKAYDRVDRDWLFAVLRAVGLPPAILNVLAGLYSSPSTRVAVLGSFSDPVPLGVGVLQGDASSCILYNLSLQPSWTPWRRVAWALPCPFLVTSPLLPAILLVRRGRRFTSLQSANTRADGLFGRLAHALATVDLGLDPAWVDLPAPALLTLPWALPSISANVPGLNLPALDALRTAGWITWADVLWRSASTPRRRVRYASFPLGPPPGDSVVARGPASHPIYRVRQLDGPPRLARLWSGLWAALPAPVRCSLGLLASGASHVAPPATDPPAAHLPPAADWWPIQHDETAADFPWHLLTVAGRPLSQSSTASIRRSLQAAVIPTPRWSPDRPPCAPFSEAMWARLWLKISRLPLSSTVRTSTLLILHRNVWAVSDDTGAPAACPNGCLAFDSPSHGYFRCPEARAVWAACADLLPLLGCPRPLTLDPIDLLAAWNVPPALLPRFSLWRSAVLHVLYSARHDAALGARAAEAAPDFRFSRSFDSAGRTVTVLAELLTAAWARVASRPGDVGAAGRARFHRLWLDGGALFRLDDSGTLSLAALPA